MTLLARPESSHLANLDSFVPEPSRSWLEDLRRSGIERFKAVGLPDSTDEEWRYTTIWPVTRTSFKLAGRSEASEDFGRHTLGDDACCELVFVNGILDGRLSRTAGLPRGLSVLGLAEAAADSPHLRHWLGRIAAIEANPFVALNTAFIRDGAFIHVARGATIEKPVHLLFISVGDEVPVVSHPRVFVLAESGSVLPLVETYAGRGRGYLTNAVTEIHLGEQAQLDYNRLQRESIESFHVSTTAVRLESGADLVSHATTLGARVTRNDLSAFFMGERAHATVNGLVIIGGDQHADNHTLLHHEKPNCPSHELYKHVLSDRASGVFKGKIFVQKNAIGTDSKQTSKSLLLSDSAVMNSQPALEIYADDVKCTHGSTTGPVDEDMVFYLRTRGVGVEAARHLLTYAFAADITRRIRVEPVRRRIEEFMAAQHDLPLDLRITDLGRHDEKSR